MDPIEKEEAPEEPKLPKRAARTEDGSVVWTLEYPVVRGEEKVTSMTLRRPRAKDLEAMDQARGAIGKQVLLLSGLSGLEPVVIRRLDAKDFDGLGDVVNGMLGKSPATGEIS